MKYQNKKDDKQRGNNEFKRLNKLQNRWQMIYNERSRKFRFAKKQEKENEGLDEYVFYSVLNTDIVMESGVAASIIARGVLALHNQLAAIQKKRPHIVQWKNSGELIIVLHGYNHRHLKHLEKEAKFTALDNHALYHRCHRWHQNLMLVLTIFGRKEETEDIFHGMKRLR